MVREFKPRIGLHADSSEPGACFGFCVSLSLSLPLPLLRLCLSLSPKINKKEPRIIQKFLDDLILNEKNLKLNVIGNIFKRVT